jgi:hypothetical protein
VSAHRSPVSPISRQHMSRWMQFFVTVGRKAGRLDGENVNAEFD